MDTCEVEITSSSSTCVFGARGDSGSIITNQQGELIGLLFAAASPAKDLDIGYMTPIDAILDDVKHLSGGFLSFD